MDPADTAASPLHAMFDNAKRFGLTDQEVWWAVDECLYDLGTEATVREYLDELAGALARRVLSSQRRDRSAQWHDGAARKRRDFSSDRF